MASRGVFFALSAHDAQRLVDAQGDDDAVMAVIEEIEEQWDDEALCEVDKAWDAIHRSLTVDPDDEPVLAKVVLGGRSLYAGDGYIVSLLLPDEVRVASDAIEDIDELDMNDRYYRIDAEAYGMPLSDEDAEYTLSNFEDMKAFFSKAASSKRAVIFTVDQ